MDFGPVKEAFEKHPVAIVLAGVALFLVLRASGSNSAAAGVDPNAQLSANTQLQMASIAGGNELAKATLSAQVQSQSINASHAENIAAIRAQAEANVLGYNAQLATLATNLQVATATLAAGVHTADLNAQTQQLSIAASAETTIEQIRQQGQSVTDMVNGQIALATISGQVMTTGILANRDIAIRQSDNSVSIAQIAANASAEQSGNELLGNIGGALISAMF